MRWLLVQFYFVISLQDNCSSFDSFDHPLRFLIGGNGRVYEGAGWHHVGAHTLGYNRRAVGISFIGDFRTKIPSPLALKALRSLLACGVQNKYLAEDYYLVGHGQLSQTDSPGEMLQKHVEMWPHWLDHAKDVLN
uniref:Peptidoglycan recognition protein family domain-containing protein n=1 Tax=Heliothis virescens TaxID=7102 RepID=A0A2A4J0F1_HELVI